MWHLDADEGRRSPSHCFGSEAAIDHSVGPIAAFHPKAAIRFAQFSEAPIAAYGQEQPFVVGGSDCFDQGQKQEERLFNKVDSWKKIIIPPILKGHLSFLCLHEQARGEAMDKQYCNAEQADTAKLIPTLTVLSLVSVE